MAKCECWHDKGDHPYCSGTKELDWCSCGGDRKKCDFYEEVREKAVLEKAQEYNKTSMLSYFQWNSMDISPLQGIENEHPDILICYINNAGDVCYKAFKYLDKHSVNNLTRDDCIAWEDCIAWCYIKQPDGVMSKEEATLVLQRAGILDDAGNIQPVYRNIITKVENL
jgi:hypothetical protein